LDDYARSVKIAVGRGKVYVDLGAERVLAAEKGEEKIAIEVKSFRGTLDLHEIEVALGQYVLYRSHMSRLDPPANSFWLYPIVS
jgi:hypothetical protein